MIKLGKRTETLEQQMIRLQREGFEVEIATPTDKCWSARAWHFLNAEVTAKTPGAALRRAEQEYRKRAETKC